MAILFSYPTVEGNLGILTKKIHSVQAEDILQAAVNSITEAEFAAVSVVPGDAAYITFSDEASALYQLPIPFGTLQVFDTSPAP